MPGPDRKRLLEIRTTGRGHVPVGALRPCRPSSATICSCCVPKTASTRPPPMNCPMPRAGFQPGPEVLSRPAAAWPSSVPATNEPSGSCTGSCGYGVRPGRCHIFCTEEQIQAEVSAFIDLPARGLCRFRLHRSRNRLSTRPAQRVGDDADWDRARKALADALDAEPCLAGAAGEGAPLRPQDRVFAQDCLGRPGGSWVPSRSISPCRGGWEPSMWPRMAPPGAGDAARAILGSFERFIGILIEHYEDFPHLAGPRPRPLC